jgi:hypothetical protein
VNTVEPVFGDRPVDRDAPKHASVTGEGIGVGKRGDRPRRCGDGLIITNVGQGDRGGSHQAPIARGALRVIKVVVP